MEDPKQHVRLSTKQLLLQNMDYVFDIFLICLDYLFSPDSHLKTPGHTAWGLGKVSFMFFFSFFTDTR